MCGRYTLTNPDPARIRARFGLDESREGSPGERATTSPPPIRCWRSGADDGGARAGAAALGPGARALGRAPGRPLINARAETLQSQPAFAESFRERRCLIPADGFYEWRRGRARKDARSGSAAPTATCSPSPASGRQLPARDGSGEPAQLRDRHLRAERADSPDPRPHAGDPGARGRGAVARSRRVAGRAARPAGSGARRTARGSRGRSTRSTTSARTGPTCSTPARPSRSCSSDGRSRRRGARPVPEGRLVDPGEASAGDLSGGSPACGGGGWSIAAAACGGGSSSSPASGTPPTGRSSSTCHSWLKPIIATRSGAAGRARRSGSAGRAGRPEAPAG